MRSNPFCGAMLAVVACAVVAALIAPRSRAQSTAPRPNVVVILADDLGYSDLGCYGGEIATPHLDRLAAGGVRFSQFYNQARCCPSRAALLTGRYPHQVGLGAMIDDYARWIREAADRPSYRDHLSPDSPTLPELLRTAGYRTLMAGKWHLGTRPAEWPNARGFDRSFALVPGAMNYWGGESTGPRNFMVLDEQRWTPPQDGFFATDAFTDRAIEFLEEGAIQKKNRPFFLYLAYNAPHWPLHAPPEDVEPYAGKYDAGWQAIRQQRFKKMVNLGVVPAETKMAPMDRGVQKPWNELTDEQRREWALRMGIYAAQVTRMDRNIGRLVEKLNELGVADSTLVLFFSDNGGAAEDPRRGRPGAAPGSRDSFRGYARPWASVSNTPWRNHKISAYEGGVSTPAIAYWPAGIPKDAQGRWAREPAHLLDVMPTLLELARATYPATDARGMEGRSILPMIRGQTGSADRTFCWEHEGNRGIRRGDWKLVSVPNREWELYDLKTDRAESHDVAAENPEIVRELSAEYDRWAKRCDVADWSQIAVKRPAQ